MPPITILIKPASGACNMHCEYCFYKDEEKLRKTQNFGMMCYAICENIIKKAFAYAYGSCTFAFQGGEPTLSGLAFYEDFLKLCSEHRPHGLKVNFALQTNGYLIDKSWAQFFAKNNFLIGLSLDGTKDLHDLFRKDKQGQGTYSKTLRAAQIMQGANVEFNILTVVTKPLAKKVREVYGFFKRNSFMYQQYIPCLDGLWQERGKNDYSLTPTIYAEFLINLFDLYYDDFKRGKPVSIRYFDNLVGMLLGNAPESCGMLGICGIQYVAEADGGIYPCDFYVLDKYLLGNINDDDFLQFDEKRKEIGFVENSKAVVDKCVECRYYPLCRGGCRRDKEQTEGDIGLNYLCDAYKMFFNSRINMLEAMAKQIFQGGNK